jgi:hypothetical protein
MNFLDDFARSYGWASTVVVGLLVLLLAYILTEWWSGRDGRK